MTCDEGVLHFAWMSPLAVLCPLLIGRDELLELADRRLADVLAGQRPVPAPGRRRPGIGKTRLLGAIAARPRPPGSTAVAGRPSRRRTRTVPAPSILDLARTMRLDPGASAPAADHLLDRFDRATREPRTSAATLVVDARRQHPLLGSTGPTMLVFEDLQWADDMSLEIIAELARRAADAAPARAATTGPRGAARHEPPRVARAADHPAARRGGPAAAGSTATRRPSVTTLILDTGLPAPRDVAAAVYERTDGIPLHIEELLGGAQREARADGDRDPRAQTSRTRSRTRSSPASPGCSPEAQAIARAGAVIGRCFVPGRPGRDHGRRRRRARDAAPGAGRPCVPVRLCPVDRGLLRLPPPAAARRAVSRRSRRRERRRYHARAGEFGTRLEGVVEIHASRPLRTGRPARRGVRGGDGRAHGRRPRLGPTARPSSSTGGPWTTCPRRRQPSSDAPSSSRAAATRQGRSSRTRSPRPSAAQRRGAIARRVGRSRRCSSNWSGLHVLAAQRDRCRNERDSWPTTSPSSRRRRPAPGGDETSGSASATGMINEVDAQ